MASYQEYATYSETGETFKDKDCQVLSLSFEEEGKVEGRLCMKGARGVRETANPVPPCSRQQAASAGLPSVGVPNVSLASLTNYKLGSKCNKHVSLRLFHKHLFQRHSSLPLLFSFCLYKNQG